MSIYESSFFLLCHKPVCVRLLIFSTDVCVSRRGAVRLGMSKVTQVDFLPREMVSYSKETQTPTEVVVHTEQKAGAKRSDAEVGFPVWQQLSGAAVCLLRRRRGG